MTDAEQLVTLRAWPSWPWDALDPLAIEAARIGRLREAVREADQMMADRLAASSHSSVTIPPAQMPRTEFRCYNDRSNLWYHQLWIELHRVLDHAPLSDSSEVVQSY